MSDLELDAFALLAEVAIALSGFSGVVAAFSGRERVFRPTEHIRLMALLLNSGLVLIGCGAVYTLHLAGVHEFTAVRVVSIGALVYESATSIPLVVRAYRAAGEPDSTTEPWSLRLSTSYLVFMIALYGINSVAGATWVLVGGFWVQIAFALWMFGRVLTRAN